MNYSEQRARGRERRDSCFPSHKTNVKVKNITASNCQNYKGNLGDETSIGHCMQLVRSQNRLLPEAQKPTALPMRKQKGRTLGQIQNCTLKWYKVMLLLQGQFDTFPPGPKFPPDHVFGTSPLFWHLFLGTQPGPENSRASTRSRIETFIPRGFWDRERTEHTSQ